VLLWLSLDLHCAHDVYIYIYIYISSCLSSRNHWQLSGYFVSEDFLSSLCLLLKSCFCSYNCYATATDTSIPKWSLLIEIIITWVHAS
jgi:hypothetical protein